MRHTAVVAAGTLLILLPALINGFPFVYPDTGTYLTSAFRGEVPIDRPYYYGVFMRVSSLGGHTFWGIVTAQALLCSLYIFRTVAAFIHRRQHLVSLMVYAVLAATTSVGWYAGQLMPDAFTGIGALALFHALLGRGGRWARHADGALVIFSCWVHLSHLLILPLSGAVMLLAHRRSVQDLRPRAGPMLATLTVLAWGGLAVANRMVDRAFYISRCGHVFLVAHMVDNGMLKSWLDEHCPEGSYRLCAYKDHLPVDSGHFLWADSISPMHLEGGWLATRPEYERIIRGTLIEPRYLGWHLRSSLSCLGDQLTRWTICSGLESKWYRTPVSEPYYMIQGTIRSALPDYLSSLQNGGRGELSMRWPDRLYAISTLGSVLVAVILLFRRPTAVPRTRRAEWALLLSSVGTVIIACWVCSTLAVTDDRYLGRISWLLPLTACIVIARHWQHGTSPEAPHGPRT